MSGNISLKELMEQRKNEGHNSTEIVAPEQPSDEQLVEQLVSYYMSMIDNNKVIADEIIAALEDGVIALPYQSYRNETLANVALARIIELSASEPIEVEPTDVTDEWIEEVTAAARIYADDLLYESIILWCKAVKWDRQMCKPIVRGYGQFFQQIEELGFPHLCLLIAAIK
jgi:hypothetical protein